jgi:hypothetical protein
VLSGPSAAELTALSLSALSANPSTLRDAQVLLLRDGALAYAMHAHVTTLADLTAAIESLALPNPAPFRRMTEKLRADTESVLRSSGVDAGLAASLSGR